VRSHVVEVSTPDFKHYSEPIFNFDGEEDGWLGMCSPDVQRLNGKYVMTFNSWGDKPGKPNQLFYRASDDLVHWTPRRTLGLNLTQAGNQRVIDAALAPAAAVYDWRKYDGYYYVIYAGRNEGQTYAKRGWNQIALARSKDLIHWSVPGE
jgi:hypothetical protein